MSQDEKAGFLEKLAEKLGKIGVDFEAIYGDDMKVVCVSNIGQSLKDLSEVAKEHVVMVRVDEDTLRKLDSWIEAGVVKSRSEAALLFIREGLQARQSELNEMEAALADLEAAKAKLHERAQSLFGAKKGEAVK
jgi:Arc/MetJ-type ribon-helix-helix transcriptional regulator